jgi:hypothetical protein
VLQKIELALLGDQVLQLRDSSYFNQQIHPFCDDLSECIENLKGPLELPHAILSRIIEEFWSTLKYLSGSASNEIPYEMQFCLNLVLEDWGLNDCIITTALTANRDFHFSPLDTWGTYDAVFRPGKTRKRLLQIALPRIYRHHPLLNTALYHEVGHYIDNVNAVAEASLQLEPSPIALKLCPPFLAYVEGFEKNQPGTLIAIERNHRKEYFADLVAACYIDRSSSEYLTSLDPEGQPSITHPKTGDRSVVVESFLSGHTAPIVDLMNAALVSRKLPILSNKLEEPKVETQFLDLRPVDLQSVQQVHGLIPAAWSFYKNRGNWKSPPWSSIPTHKAFNLINDLTEKSLRNYDLVRKWHSAT